MKKKKLIQNKTFRAWTALITLGVFIYFVVLPNLNMGPVNERNNMILLEQTKLTTEISEFKSDGCSGYVSEIYEETVKGISNLSPNFKEKFKDSQQIPFEESCIKHDDVYHRGEGGYEARLIADNILRAEIIKYGIENTEEIMRLSGLETKEEAMSMYELIADAVYLGVRVGGGPCSGEPYAWGFGYDNGVCVK